MQFHEPDVNVERRCCHSAPDQKQTVIARLRRTALSLLKNEPTAKVGIKNKRLTAGWDEDYLAKVLFQSQL